MNPETLHRKVAEFEAAYNYDASYQHEMIDAAPEVAARFATVPLLVDRNAAPPAPLVAASIAAFFAEDCEPCAQLSLDMAAQAGVEADVLRAIVAGDEAAMGEEAALAWRFARAVIAHDEVAASPLRREILHRWGSAGLVALAMSITTTKVYPTVKYALGHGKPIRQLKVEGKPAPLATHRAEAA